MKKVLCVLMILGLTGCQKGWFRDRSKDYSKAETDASIQVSPQYHPEPFGKDYSIPS